jgi:putative ABC transport system permease protein
VVFEVALCLVLLVSATLLIRSFAGLLQIDPGLRADHVLAFRAALPPGRYRTMASLAQFDRELAGRLAALPGVVAAASVTTLPLELGPDLPYDIEGQPGAGPTGEAQWRAVTPGYFTALGVPLRAGRFTSDADDQGGQPVVIVNEALVRRHLRGRNPIGARITLGRQMGPLYADATRVVVGVVGDIRETGLDSEVPETVYLPKAQLPPFWLTTIAPVVPPSWVVRSIGPPRALLAAVQREMQAQDPLVAVADVRAMTEVVDRSIAQRRFNMTLLLLFAGLALALAMIGIHGVIAYTVTQRTREIGIRMALGASARRTLRMLLGQTMRLVGLGLAGGVVVALAAGRVLSGVLYGVSASDPLTFLLAVVAVSAAAGAAGLLAAARALRIDPVVALRAE